MAAAIIFIATHRLGPAVDGQRSTPGGSTDTTVRLWNIERGHCDAIFAGCHSARVLCLDADFDSGFVLSGSKDKTVNVWQIDGAGGPRRQMSGKRFAHVCVALPTR